MNNVNKQRAAQLGMPFGTANGRLRKSILFRFAQRLGEDKCFKCGNKIQTIEEFSIEHKLPWFNRNSDLFWDLDNIAFSHLKCNRPESYPGPPKRIAPEGKSWCSSCGDFLPVEKFSIRRSRWNGLSESCKFHAQQFVYKSRPRSNHLVV